MSAVSIDVRVIESGPEFAALGAEWEGLQQEAAVTSVFGSFDWQHLWWKHYGRGQPLKLLVASEGDALTGILPLYIHTIPLLRYPVRHLRFVGTGGDTFPDDLGPVLAAGREADTARALAEAVLALRGWDVLLLGDMDPASPFPSAMEAAARQVGFPCRTGRSERIAYLDLPATWDEWLETLHRDRRWRIRSARKKASQAHEARFFVWREAATLDRAVDRLIHLHHKRWESVGQQHGFSSPEYVQFHRSVMAACLARDRLRLYCLELSGEIVAMAYFYRFRNRVYLMQSGFDPDHARLRPGQVLLGHIVESAIKEGNTVLDFLKGEHRYKDEIASGERETRYLTVFRPGLGAWVHRARRLYLPALKASLRSAVRRIVPPAPPPAERP